ncbi:MAG: hypothetical protein Dbin4_02237 [Alphaproteobacteria bacterium]|nr:hypothetical protein [Alphaproteobacteria bacterium]
MQRFTRNDAGELIPVAPAVGAAAQADSVDGNLITRLLEEVARQIQFSEDAAFYVSGPTGNILFITSGYQSIAGAPPENGRVTSDVFNFIRNNGESYVRDEVIQSNGRARFVRSFHYPLFDYSNTLLGIVGHYVESAGSAVEATNTVQQTSRLQDQLRASSDLFWELDANGKLTALSDRATDILGKPAALFMGMGLDAIGRFINRDGADAPIPAGLSKHQPFRNAIFLMQAENSPPFFMHMSAVPFFEPANGRFLGHRGVGVNVTERFQAEDRAAKAHRELELAREALINRNAQLEIERGRTEKALRAKTEFLATMSHELRTPLNAILGFSETMTMKLFGGLNDQYAGYAEDILKSGRHLLSLINAMLDTAQIDGNEVSPNPKEIDIDELIDQSVSIVQLRARAKNIDLRNAVIQSGCRVKADPLLTTQILVNLFSNAVKFTEPGGSIGVEITAGRHIGFPMAAITVWDTGIGVPPEMQNQIFEKFVRGNNARAYDDIGQGIGLGLHVSKRLAELMHGSIRLQSVPGHGSRFTLELPLATTPREG